MHPITDLKKRFRRAISPPCALPTVHSASRRARGPGRQFVLTYTDFLWPHSALLAHQRGAWAVKRGAGWGGGGEGGLVNCR